MEVGAPVATRTTAPPKLDEAGQAAQEEVRGTSTEVPNRVA
jgi:hypothetical protein